MFTLTMHPASEGDCLQLTWGDATAPHHAIIDLGRTKNYRELASHLKALTNIELLVISHIDADHIEGAVPMVKEAAAPFAPTDVWFNGHRHLHAAVKRRNLELHKLSPAQGEKLSDGIEHFKWPWNRAFEPSGIVSVDTPLKAPLQLNGGLRITMLSPSDAELAALEPIWVRELAKANLRPSDADDPKPDVPAGMHALSSLNVAALAAEPYRPDRTEPNGSSIAFLAEYEGRVALLGADAFPEVIERSLRRLGYSEANRLELDLFKVCHHGSKANTSPALLKMIDCKRFAISTDGSRHGHPDVQSIARILVNDKAQPKTLYFNFAQPSAKTWQNQETEREFGYTCVFPAGNGPGLTIDIECRPKPFG